MKIMQPTASEVQKEKKIQLRRGSRVVAVGHAGAKGLQRGAAMVVAAATSAAMIKEGITKSDPIFGSIELHLTPLNHTFNYRRAPKVLLMIILNLSMHKLRIDYIFDPVFCDLHSISPLALLLFF